MRTAPPKIESSEIGLWQYVRAVKPEIESALLRYLPIAPARSGENGRLFNEALRYALFPGGKRLRPVLTLLGAEIIGGKWARVLAAATAVEFLHTSSLIFDDLPCMDDAMERRGKEALHRRYNESLAILVALNLMNASYALIFEAGDGDYQKAIKAHREIVECIGASGMVTGQTVDLISKQNGNDWIIEDRFNFDPVRNLKTTALMRMALRVGASLSGANERQLAALSNFAQLLGEAYQISDDVLDLIEDETLANDARIAKTYALDCGERAARRRVAALVRRAQNLLLAEFSQTPPSRLLCELADYIATRKS